MSIGDQFDRLASWIKRFTVETMSNGYPHARYTEHGLDPLSGLEPPSF